MFRSSSGTVVSDAARLQLAAIRDEWLAPLVERIGGLERENGDLAGQLAARADVLAAKDETIAELRRRAEAAEAERLAAEGELDALRLQLAEVAVPPVVVVAAQDATETPPATIPTSATAPRLWTRLRRALGRT